MDLPNTSEKQTSNYKGDLNQLNNVSFPFKTPGEFFKQWTPRHANQVLNPTTGICVAPTIPMLISNIQPNIISTQQNFDFLQYIKMFQHHENLKTNDGVSDANHNNNDTLKSLMEATKLSERDIKNKILTDDNFDQLDVPVAVNPKISSELLMEFTKVAMRGCDIAEELSQTHRARPCFKKLDSLCARIKQDLTRPDGVLANINSQGIAWAVKDFIFVFTRIINAWTIIKGYVYNTPEGLSKVKSSLSSDFDSSFLRWQDSTIDFIDNLIESYVNLNQLVLNQRTQFHKSDTPIKSTIYNSSNDIDKNLSDNQKSEKIFNNMQDSSSDETQSQASENGTYLKTGIYNFPNKIVATHQKPEILYSFDKNLQQNSDNNLNARDEKDAQKNNINTVKFLDEQNISNIIKKPDCKVSNKLNYQVINFNEQITIDDIDNLTYLINLICDLDELKYFFSGIFTNNYFPNFMDCFPNFVDLRTIILRFQVGAYKNIYEIVHDIRQIIYCSKIYLEKNPLVFLKNLIYVIENEFNNILDNDMFSKYNFTNITGNPKDKIMYNN